MGNKIFNNFAYSLIVAFGVKFVNAIKSNPIIEKADDVAGPRHPRVLL